MNMNNLPIECLEIRDRLIQVVSRMQISMIQLFYDKLRLYFHCLLLCYTFLICSMQKQQLNRLMEAVLHTISLCRLVLLELIRLFELC